MLRWPVANDIAKNAPTPGCLSTAAVAGSTPLADNCPLVLPSTMRCTASPTMRN